MPAPLTLRERRDYYYQNKHWLPKDVPLCINCKHFYQHYVHAGPPKCTAQYFPVACGHCGYPRLKSRKAYDTCEYFEQKGKGVEVQHE